MNFTSLVLVASMGVALGLTVGSTVTMYAYAGVLVADRLYGITSSLVVYYGTLGTFVFSIIVALLNLYGARKVVAERANN